MVENHNLETTKKRLNEIEKELSDLKSQKVVLDERWKLEKQYIQDIRNFKILIEEAKVKADEYERYGDLAKFPELRYGKIPELEKKLKLANEKLDEIQKSGKMLKEEVGSEDIAEIVAKWTGIPVQKMLETEKTKLLHIEERLHQRVIGQDEAVSAVANAIRRSRAGFQDVNRPIGSFIFLGTTGVGKTEMARALAEYLFDSENSMIRIDMSEYMEKYSVSRLIGAPPGYVGYEEGGQLTEAVRQRPYSVVLLDEIEKANSEVFNVLLQVLDDGRLTDGKGRTVNFKNTIIIMTSNLGTEVIQDRILEINEQNRDKITEDLRLEIFELLRKRVRPEFLNRIDEIILFKPLTKSEIIDIAKYQLKELSSQLKQNGIQLKISDKALNLLANFGFDIQYGARPLKRAIQKFITNIIAVKFLSGEYSNGATILLDAQGNDFIFKKV